MTRITAEHLDGSFSSPEQGSSPPKFRVCYIQRKDGREERLVNISDEHDSIAIHLRNSVISLKWEVVPIKDDLLNDPDEEIKSWARDRLTSIDKLLGVLESERFLPLEIVEKDDQFLEPTIVEYLNDEEEHWWNYFQSNQGLQSIAAKNIANVYTLKNIFSIKNKMQDEVVANKYEYFRAIDELGESEDLLEVARDINDYFFSLRRKTG